MRMRIAHDELKICFRNDRLAQDCSIAIMMTTGSCVDTPAKMRFFAISVTVFLRRGKWFESFCRPQTPRIVGLPPHQNRRANAEPI